MGRLTQSDWAFPHGTDGQVHSVAARQPDGGLVHGRLLVGGRVCQFLRRGAGSLAPIDGVLARSQQSARQGLSVRHH